MKIEPACYPCALNRLSCTAHQITEDSWLHHRLLRGAMQELASMRRDATPAEMMFMLESLASKTLGAPDPYHAARKEWRRELADTHAAASRRIAAAADPLGAALLYAARANVFDDEQLSPREIRIELERTGLRAGEPPGSDGFAASAVEAFRLELEQARDLLFLHDSAPELPFDRALIERLGVIAPNLRVSCVVRSQPILLDATREDALHYGISDLPNVARVLDPGIFALGTPLDECSSEFRDSFAAAGIVLAKGQAHFETLENCGRPVYHLLRVKCRVMAKCQGVRVGDEVFLKGPAP
ncbi:MAG: ARMT1-like domain-containing protein [Planctomycetes bacterium]|nr:ARMT1-like domain-containing protein [Planctomycetota bacterium]